jgi:hypothetical protein
MTSCIFQPLVNEEINHSHFVTRKIANTSAALGYVPTLPKQPLSLSNAVSPFTGLLSSFASWYQLSTTNHFNSIVFTVFTAFTVCIAFTVIFWSI